MRHLKQYCIIVRRSTYYWENSYTGSGMLTRMGGSRMEPPWDSQEKMIRCKVSYYPPWTTPLGRTQLSRPKFPETKRHTTRHTDTDTEGCQTIQNQYPGITSYPNHVMYVPRPTGNLRPFALWHSYNSNNIEQLIIQFEHRSLKWNLAYPSAIVFQPVFLSLHGRLQ